MKQKRALLSQTAIDSLVHFSWHPHRGQTNEVGQDIGHFCVFVSWKRMLMPSHLEWGDCGRWANAPNWFLFSLFYFMRYDHQGLWLVTTSYISDCPQPIVKDQGKISSLGTMWNHSHSRKSLIYSVLKIFFPQLLCPTAGISFSAACIFPIRCCEGSASFVFKRNPVL